MSAWVVNRRHIDAMIRAGFRYSGSGSNLTWFKAKQDPEPEAYQRGAPWGPENVAIANTRREELTRENASNVGRMLLFENMRSVAHRYDEPTTLPEYEYSEVGLEARSPVDMLKAIQCYEYQTCEHPGWENSSAKAFCEQLTGLLIHKLPGYDDAPWGIDE